MLDSFELSQMNKSKALTAKVGPAFVCVINGCPQEPDSWRVKLPGAGLACTGCAHDKGWAIL